MRRRWVTCTEQLTELIGEKEREIESKAQEVERLLAGEMDDQGKLDDMQGQIDRLTNSHEQQDKEVARVQEQAAELTSERGN